MIDPMRGILQTDTTVWTLGPLHPALPGRMRVSLELDGEFIASSKVERGFSHRGIEKVFEKKKWVQGIPLAGRVDPEGSIFGEMAYVMAVEALCGVEVPERAQWIRIAVSELARISSHLSFLGRIALQSGFDTFFHFVFRDREKILDLFELLSGARHFLTYLRFGGVSAEVTDGFIERTHEFCDLIQQRFKEYNDLFCFNHALVKRTAGLAPLSVHSAVMMGVTGPNARASGAKSDLRVDDPRSCYDQVDFDISVGPFSGASGGDLHDRIVIRLREIAASAEILRQVCDSIPKGRFRSPAAPGPFLAPAGEAYQRVEGSRGVVGCHVVCEGGASPSRVAYRSPSLASLEVLPELLRGTRIEDFSLILASLDLSMGEIDR